MLVLFIVLGRRCPTICLLLLVVCDMIITIYYFAVIMDIFKEEGLEVLGWRPVPVNMSVVGYYAKETMPNIQQIFVKVSKESNIDDIERELYVCRKLIERAAQSKKWGDELYFCSLSNQTIVYKGMLRSEVLGPFYLDLQSDLYKSPFAIYHRRYSTNTSPRWPLAQPMRLLGHNGEINTIQVCFILSLLFMEVFVDLYYFVSMFTSCDDVSSGKFELDAIPRGINQVSCLAWP